MLGGGASFETNLVAQRKQIYQLESTILPPQNLKFLSMVLE